MPGAERSPTTGAPPAYGRIAALSVIWSGTCSVGGHRTPSLPAVVLLVIGLAVTAFAPNPSVLAVARLLGGIGAGALLGSAAALVVGVVAAQRTAVVLVAGIGVVLAAVPGAVVGDLLTTQLSFRAGFLLALVLVLIAGLATAVVAVVGLVRRGPGPVATVRR